jgi:CPA1 family monovalent cation:H+ antiporter
MDLNPLILIFVIACIVAILAKYIKWPYTITLVIAGIIVAALGIQAPFKLDRDILFQILLPPLLFEGAFYMRMDHLKQNSKVILLLILPGLMFAVFFTGIMLNLFFPAIPLIFALLLAAIVIPTDPAAILAFYRDMKIPKKLKAIIEGESVFDDGLAIVLFNVIVGIILVADMSGGNMIITSGSIGNGILEFLKLSFLGIVLGWAAGYVTVLIIKKIDDKFTEIMITVILAFGIFAVAEMVGASGVFAVVIAGLMLGNYGTRFAMAPSTRMSLISFWSFLAFGVNSILFILIGMNVGISAIIENIWIIVVTVLLLWAARAMVIGVIGLAVNRKKVELQKRGQVMMWWGGLRGAIPIVMALSIPVFLADGITPFPHRELILTTTFGVVLATLLVQGLTLRRVLKGLGFSDAGKKGQPEMQASALMRDSSAVLMTLKEDGDFQRDGYDWLSAKFAQANSMLLTEMGALMNDNGFIPKEEYTAAIKESLALKRNAVKEAWEKKMITGDAAEKLIIEIDEQIKSQDTEQSDLKLERPTEMLKRMTARAEGGAPMHLICGSCMKQIDSVEVQGRCRCGTAFHKDCYEKEDRCPVCIAVLDKDRTE